MAELIYQTDCYIKDFEAKVTRVEGNKVFLDRTAFHPISGGVANDTGFIESSSGRWSVINVVEEGGDVAHLLDSNPDLKVGDVVRGHLDWDRRYRLMRLHTADHILAAILYKEKGALVTGGHIDPEHAKSDFSLERGAYIPDGPYNIYKNDLSELEEQHNVLFKPLSQLPNDLLTFQRQIGIE